MNGKKDPPAMMCRKKKENQIGYLRHFIRDSLILPKTRNDALNFFRLSLAYLNECKPADMLKGARNHDIKRLPLIFGKESLTHYVVEKWWIVCVRMYNYNEWDNAKDRFALVRKPLYRFVRLHGCWCLDGRVVSKNIAARIG